MCRANGWLTLCLYQPCIQDPTAFVVPGQAWRVALRGVDVQVLAELLDDRFDGPFQAEGYVTSQRNSPALGHHATVRILECRNRDAKESLTSIRRQHSLVWVSHVFHFRNPRRPRAADPTVPTQGTVVHVMVSIENHSH
jgi:hypothetical protein